MTRALRWVLLRGFTMILAVVLPDVAFSQDVLEGPVSHVRDGDTLEIGGVAVHLNGLHAPEVDEPGGPEAAAFMRSLLEGQILSCQLNGEESYDRLVAICYLNGKDVAQLLVESGLGRDCPRFSGGRYQAV